MTRMFALFAFVIVALLAGPGRAHDSRPLAVTVTEETAGRYRIDWRTPPSVEAFNAPRLVLAPPCAPETGEPRHALSGRALFACPGAPAVVEIDYAYFNPSLSTLIRIDRRNGERAAHLLGPEATRFDIGAGATFAGVAKSYFILGVEHILIGIDHILFLAGLLILARTPRRVLVTVTGFTLAHSLTLALVALDMVRVSIPAVEATIALSIVFVAAEIARGDRGSLAWRRPAIVACAFGLLHGAGFAAVLGEIGLPATERVAALLFFNLGVEAGQLLIVLAAFAAIAAIRRLRRVARGEDALPAAATPIAGYALGLVSALWFVERTVAVFAA